MQTTSLHWRRSQASSPALREQKSGPASGRCWESGFCSQKCSKSNPLGHVGSCPGCGASLQPWTPTPPQCSPCRSTALPNISLPVPCSESGLFPAPQPCSSPFCGNQGSATLTNGPHILQSSGQGGSCGVLWGSRGNPWPLETPLWAQSRTVGREAHETPGSATHTRQCRQHCRAALRPVTKGVSSTGCISTIIAHQILLSLRVARATLNLPEGSSPGPNACSQRMGDTF